MSSFSKYKEKYSRFCTHLRRNWINVLFHENVASILETHCQTTSSEQYLTDEPSPVGSNLQNNIRLRPENLLNFVKSSTGTGSEWAFEWTLVSSIALFEAFVSDIAELVYLSNPKNFLLSEQNNENQTIKLQLLLDSETKDEAIEKYVEQKLIGIFYGDPSNAFVKYKETKQGREPRDGSLKLDTGVYLHQKAKSELRLYVEMTKRRNVIVHNAGIINDRYTKEVPDNYPNRLQLGEKIKIDKTYLFDSINALYTLARFYSIKAIHTAYKTGNQTEDNALLSKLEKQFK